MPETIDFDEKIAQLAAEIIQTPLNDLTTYMKGNPHLTRAEIKDYVNGRIVAARLSKDLWEEHVFTEVLKNLN